MKGRILVVDDNPTNQKLACDLLEFEGYQVDRAGDAEEAQLMIGDAQFDLVLMDIELPGMDGLALTRLIKEDPATRSLIVVALTAFAMKGDDQKAFDAGCSGYLTKPIDTRKFPQQIAGFLVGQKVHEENKFMQILVVDDEPYSLKLAQAVTETAGYKVRGVANGLAALAAIATEKPDLILTDLMLPEMDGLTLIRHIKANPETESIPIIVITAFPDTFNRDSALEAGAAGYVVKPINTRAILDMIDRVLTKEPSI